MAAKIHGRLAALDCAATTSEAVYTCPASRKATGFLNLCNRNSTSVTFRAMHLNGAIGTLANEDYIEYGVTLAANGTYNSPKMTVTTAHVIGTYISATGVSAQFIGVEEDA